MRKYQIKSLPLKEVIEDFSNEFGTEYTKDCQEYKLSLPEDVGEGSITGINFDSGLGILNYECRFREDTEVRFTVNNVHPAKFLYCTAGSLGHSFDAETGQHTIDQYQNAIVASSGHSGHILYFPEDSLIRINSLEIDRKKFLKRLECGLETIPQSLQELLEDIKAKSTFYHEGDYSLIMADCLDEMNSFDQSGFLRRMFMEAKSYEMLSLQIMQYEDDLKEERSRNMLRRSEVEKIREAIRIIKAEMPHLETVRDLATRVGTNENKLQSGFKHVTGSTVNQYIKNGRMDAAKELLISSDLSISEIVYSIGLSNRGYFAKMFKERYNVSPSVFRNRRERPRGQEE